MRNVSDMLVTASGVSRGGAKSLQDGDASGEAAVEVTGVASGAASCWERTRHWVSSLRSFPAITVVLMSVASESMPAASHVGAGIWLRRADPSDVATNVKAKSEMVANPADVNHLEISSCMPNSVIKAEKSALLSMEDIPVEMAALNYEQDKSVVVSCKKKN